MTNLEKYKTELKRAWASNPDDFFEKMNTLLKTDRESFNGFIHLQSAFNRNKKNEVKSINSKEVENQMHALLTSSVLNYIDSLKEEDIAQSEQHEHILVVCKIPEREKFLRKYFPKKYFKNIDFDSSGKKRNAIGKNIIVFDNYPHDSDDGKHVLLSHYLENTEPVILYFGRFLMLLTKYPEKAYATNSVFSLHARIKEINEFLKYQKAYILENKES